jgi:signal transduction histidine kinase
VTPARRRTSKVATPPRDPTDHHGPPAGDPWALLQACRVISAELALPPLLLRLASALTEASGALRVCLILPGEGTLLVQAEAVRGPDGQVRARPLEPVPLDEHPGVSVALVQAAAQGQQAQWQDAVGPARRAIWCAPILRPSPHPPELQALAHLESDHPGGLHSPAVGALLAQATISLENARQHRETLAALRVREDFLSEAAHELYTPLSSLKLVLDTLSPTVPGTPAADQAIFAKSVEIARRQGRRLERLIRELLELSRLDTGKLRLELQEMDLGQLTREVVEHLAVEAGRAGCRVSVQADGTPVLGRWDRSRLDQVIANLLANAFKFGPGQPVEITVARGEGSARLVVRDNGIGVDPCEQGFIFDRFKRAAGSRHYGGLGLGLYICRAIVQAHGGSITVHSAPAAGATFTVELPQRMK